MKLNAYIRALVMFVNVAFATFLVAAVSALGADLVGLYTFEGASPAAFNDVSGNGLNPTSIGTVTLDASGYQGQAASFSGTHTPIAIPINISPGVTPSLTIGAWVKPDVIGSRAVFGNDNGAWDRGLAAGGTLGNLNWRPVGDGGGQVDSGIAVSTGAWQFVAVSYDYAVEHKFYKDTNTYSRATASTGGGDASLGIGALDVDGTWKFDGLIDNFFIFTNTLNNAEIEQIRVYGVSGINQVAEGLPPVTIDVVGDGTNYDETGMQGWRSTNVPKSFDIGSTPADNVYGSLGLFFIGKSPYSGYVPDATFANFTQVGAAWATFSAGADATAYYTPDAGWNYADIDDPNATPGVNVADWDIQSGYVRNIGAGLDGDWEEVLTFTLNNTAPRRLRIGIMSSHADGGQFAPTGLRLVADSGTSYEVTGEVTGLATVGRLTGMVFFDVKLDGRAGSTFSILAERPSDAQGGMIAGVTFDDRRCGASVFKF